MIRGSVSWVATVLVATIMISDTALCGSILDSAETAGKLEIIDANNPVKYHLVTLPSTNRKRVDAMSVKFLSLIPKAMLMPKIEERSVYRLISDIYDSFEPAKKHQAELLQHCKTPFVVKNENLYSVIASSLFNEASAETEQRRLAGKNISTTILELKMPLKHWQMKSTENFNIRDAVNMAGQMAKIGITVILEPSSR